MEEMERDFVTFTDDDGNDFELDVIDYFEYDCHRNDRPCHNSYNTKKL